MRRGVVTLSVAAALGLGGAGTAIAAPPVQCGSEVSGSVELTEDLVCSGTGLIISSPFTTIDLNGHTLRYAGAPSASADGVTYRYPSGGPTGSITIRDGRITGFSRAIALDGLQDVSVEGLRLDGWVRVNYGHGFSLTDSRVAGRISADYTSGVRLLRNRVEGSINLQRASQPQLVDNVVQAGTTAHGWRETAIHLAEVNDAVVRGNRVTSEGVGIEADYYVQGAVIEDNRIQGADVGISFAGHISRDLVVRNNRVTGSRSTGLSSNAVSPQDISVLGNRVTSTGTGRGAGGGDGIRVITNAGDAYSRADAFTLADNRVSGSSGHGIYAPGVVDGGGNRSSGSRLSPPCVGVTCR